MVTCSILGCTTRSARGPKEGKEAEETIEEDTEDKVGFHRFPQDPVLREAWTKATLRKNWKPGNDSKICSRHFKPDDYRSYASGRRYLHDDAVPSSYLIYLRKPESGVKDPQVIPGVTPSQTKDFKNAQAQARQLARKLQAAVYCAVRGCPNMKLKKDEDVFDSSGNPVFFYEFPENTALRQKWIEATGQALYQNQRQTKTAICSAHFAPPCFALVGKMRLLQKNAVPTLNLPKSKPSVRRGILTPVRRIPFQVQYIEDTSDRKPSLDKLLTLNQGKILTRATANNLILSPAANRTRPNILSTSSPHILKTALSTPKSSIRPLISSSTPQTILLQTPNSNFRMTTSLSQPSTPYSNARLPVSLNASQTLLFQTPNSNFGITNLSQPSTPSSSFRQPVSSSTPETPSLQASNSNFVIKNDLTQPVVFVKTSNKVMVMPAKSAVQQRLAYMPSASCVQVNPNSCIQVQPPASRPTFTKKIPECTCPTNKFFREGSKQIRVFSDVEHKLRSKIARKTRVIKSVQISRNRCEEKCRILKKQIKDLRRANEKNDRAVQISPSVVKLFKEILKQHSQPINLDGPVKRKFGKEIKKFAVQLFSASPEAYRFVRESFNKRLPRAKTIRGWCAKAKESKEAAKHLELSAEEIGQINADDEWDSDLDDESVASMASSDEDSEKLRKSIREEVNVVIETETDPEGNILNDLPPDLRDEPISDEESDSDYEKPFSTLCEPGLIMSSETSFSESKPKAQRPVSQVTSSQVGQTTPMKKVETVVKVNTLKPKKMGPGVRFETFAI